MDPENILPSLIGEEFGKQDTYVSNSDPLGTQGLSNLI